MSGYEAVADDADGSMTLFELLIGGFEEMMEGAMGSVCFMMEEVMTFFQEVDPDGSWFLEAEMVVIEDVASREGERRRKGRRWGQEARVEGEEE